MEVDKSIVIQRPLPEVFDYVADFERVPQWAKAIKTAKKTSPGPVAVGTTMHMEVEALGQRLGADLEVITYQPGAQLTSKVSGAPVPALMRCTFEPAPDGTRVALHITARIDNPIMRLAQGRIGKIVAGQVEAALRHLKALLESRASQAGS